MNPSNEKQKNLNILVIEDDINIRSTIDYYLSQEGHHIESAVDVKEGLDMSISGAYDLIFADMDMTCANGNYFVNLLLGLNLSSKLILISRLDTITKAMRLMKSKGAENFICKPINKDLLLSIVKIYAETKTITSKHKKVS